MLDKFFKNFTEELNNLTVEGIREKPNMRLSNTIFYRMVRNSEMSVPEDIAAAVVGGMEIQVSDSAFNQHRKVLTDAAIAMGDMLAKMYAAADYEGIPAGPWLIAMAPRFNLKAD